MLANYTPEKILKTAYETKMISSGDNSPTIKISGTNSSIFTCDAPSWHRIKYYKNEAKLD